MLESIAKDIDAMQDSDDDDSNDGLLRLDDYSHMIRRKSRAVLSISKSPPVNSRPAISPNDSPQRRLGGKGMGDESEHLPVRDSVDTDGSQSNLSLPSSQMQ